MPKLVYRSHPASNGRFPWPRHLHMSLYGGQTMCCGCWARTWTPTRNRADARNVSSIYVFLTACVYPSSDNIYINKYIRLRGIISNTFQCCLFAIYKPSGNDLENHQAFHPALYLPVSLLALLMMVTLGNMALRMEGLARMCALGRRMRLPFLCFCSYFLFAGLAWGAVVIRLQL